jgi:hypothetical protein
MTAIEGIKNGVTTHTILRAISTAQAQLSLSALDLGLFPEALLGMVGAPQAVPLHASVPMLRNRSSGARSTYRFLQR